MILRHLRPPIASVAAVLLALTAVCHGAAQAESTAAEGATTATNTKARTSPSKGERQAEVWFKMLDTNRDNHLSWDEVKHIAPLAKDFKTADTDGNGQVSRDEIRTLSRQRVAERRARKAREAQARTQTLPPPSAELDSSPATQ